MAGAEGRRGGEECRHITVERKGRAEAKIKRERRETEAAKQQNTTTQVTATEERRKRNK